MKTLTLTLDGQQLAAPLRDVAENLVRRLIDRQLLNRLSPKMAGALAEKVEADTQQVVDVVADELEAMVARGELLRGVR